jgi:D-amino-acid oxidase
MQSVAVVGAGVSGLTSAIVLAERGHRTAIFAEQLGLGTTSSVAAAIWYPYDIEPAAKAIHWALETYDRLRRLVEDPKCGVSMLELRRYVRTGKIEIPGWALPLGAVRLQSDIPSAFTSGFALNVPLMDTTIYLNYLEHRLRNAGGEIHLNRSIQKLEEIDPQFEFIVNCTGIGARTLVGDRDLEPHRGQVAIVTRVDQRWGTVCEESPLTYVIPRGADCVFGGTNHVSDSWAIDAKTTASIVDECSRVLGISKPAVLAERVGLRPFRRSGVRLERVRSSGGRWIIHNYGHGGAGFTISWGCAETVEQLIAAGVSRRSGSVL